MDPDTAKIRVSGQKLLAWRLAKKLTQDQAAGLAKIPQASWHQYENGRIPRDVAVTERLIALTRRSPHALKLSDFAETEAEKDARKARQRNVAKIESGTDVNAAASKAG